jgi:hypothetical protein
LLCLQVDDGDEANAAHMDDQNKSCEVEALIWYFLQDFIVR